jgi:hypothetical protein
MIIEPSPLKSDSNFVVENELDFSLAIQPYLAEPQG